MFRFVAPILILIATPGFAQPGSDNPDLQAYLDQVAMLNREGRSIVQEHGKAYLIEAYRALINAHPDYERNVQLETRIGEIYEWDYSSRGEPPDLQSAYETYLGVIQRYDPGYEYTKLVYRRAAAAAEELDPAAARELYSGMLDTYPDDPVIQLESLYRLGALAERDGNLSQARELFDLVLNYDASDAALNPDEMERIQTLQAQAASLLMAMAVGGVATPEERIAALEEFLDENPALRDEHGDVAGDIRAAMDRLMQNQPSDEMREAMDELRRMLAERDSARAMVGQPTGEMGAEDAGPRGASESVADAAVASTATPMTTTPQAVAAQANEAHPRTFAPMPVREGASIEKERRRGNGNRAAAAATAVVCTILAAAGLFVLRNRFGL